MLSSQSAIRQQDVRYGSAPLALQEPFKPKNFEEGPVCQSSGSADYSCQRERIDMDIDGRRVFPRVIGDGVDATRLMTVGANKKTIHSKKFAV